jgi:hypothetical protein
MKTVYYQLLLDCSYSMAPAWELISSQVSTHLARLEEQLSSSDASKSLFLSRLVPIPSPSDFDSFSSTVAPALSQLNMLIPQGGSSISDTLWELLRQIPSEFAPNASQTSTYLLIVITDGWENNSTIQPWQVKEYLLSLQKQVNLEIWVVGPEHPIFYESRLLPVKGLDNGTLTAGDLDCCFKFIESHVDQFFKE